MKQSAKLTHLSVKSWMQRWLLIRFMKRQNSTKTPLLRLKTSKKLNSCICRSSNFSNSRKKSRLHAMMIPTNSRMTTCSQKVMLRKPRKPQMSACIISKKSKCLSMMHQTVVVMEPYLRTGLQIWMNQTSATRVAKDPLQLIRLVMILEMAPKDTGLLITVTLVANTLKSRFKVKTFHRISVNSLMLTLFTDAPGTDEEFTIASTEFPLMWIINSPLLSHFLRAQVSNTQN